MNAPQKLPDRGTLSNVIRFPYRPEGEAVSDHAHRGDMISSYKQYVRNETQSTDTVRAREYYVDKLTASGIDVVNATETEIEQWLRSHGWAPSSMNSALASLRHFYRWANRYGWIDNDPTMHLRRVREPRKMGRIASDQSIVHAMMKAPVDTRVMLMLGAECGLRRAEIAKVHRSDIDGEWLYVVGKGGHQRIVHLSPELLELLEHMPKRGYLFPSPVNREGHIRPDAVYRRIRRLAGVNTHSLRHRAGTVVYEGTGNNLRVAMEFLGHATMATTSKYVHTTREDLRRAAEAARLGRAA